MKEVNIISTVVTRKTEGKPVSSVNNIYMEGGGVDMAEIEKELEKMSTQILESVAENFLSSKEEDEAAAVIDFIVGLKIAGVMVNKIRIKDEDGEASDEELLTSAKILQEIETALKALEEKYIRKDQDDRTPFKLDVGGKLTAEQGLQIGASYVPGILTGSGGLIDAHANAELESLIIRRFLEVPELRFNRTKVELGNKWNAPGAGIFEDVVPDKDENDNILMAGTGYLKLEAGEYGAIAVGDICMGIFHSMNSSENATADYDDSKGTFQFAGFYTCYFTITEITGSDNKQFRYQLRPESDLWNLKFHPSPAMHFVCYGSFTNPERQTSQYTTRTYTRLLINQNTWEIGADNIGMQWGDLSNLDVHGMEMSGYSAYLNNIYMTGIIKQFDADGVEIKTAIDRGAWVSGTTYRYYDRVSYNGSLWLCVNESGTNSEPTSTNSDWLLQVASGASLSAEGRFSSNNTPYQPNSVVEFYDKVWINTEVTSSAPYPIWTDESGNRLMFADGGFMLVDDAVVNSAWKVLIDISGFTDGEDGEGLIVQYSADATNWHSVFVQGDIYIRMKIGENGVWSDAMRFIGEDGQAKDGIYTDFQFAVNTSLTVAPTTGWQDAPPTVGEGQYLWTRICVVNPNEGTQSAWEVTRIGGEKGDSMSLQGRWATGTTIPYLGVVTMADKSWSAKVTTSNPPMWCWTDESGNRLLFNDGGYILTGEVNDSEYQIVAEKGDQGEKGEKGEKGDQGDQGIQGCIYRQTEWVAGTQYRNDSALTDTIRYIDIVTVTDSSGNISVYQCKTTHTATASNKPGNTTYWQEANTMQPIYTSLLIADNAVMRFGQANQLLVLDSGNNVMAGMSGGSETSDILLWVGGTPTSAPFTVDKNGNMVATKATIEGTINVGSMYYKTISPDGGYASMDGYTLANGPGLYTMPEPSAFMQIYAVCYWSSRAVRNFGFFVHGDEYFVVNDEDGHQTFHTELHLNSNILYKFTCVPHEGGSGYLWFVSSSDMITIYD